MHTQTFRWFDITSLFHEIDEEKFVLMDTYN